MHLQFGNGTLRLTTRQAYQLHGVLKQDLKSAFSTVIKNMGSTLGACGDVNRNVMAPPAPYVGRPDYQAAEDLANDVADLLAPQSGAYYDVWLDGEKFATSVREVRRSRQPAPPNDTLTLPLHAWLSHAAQVAQSPGTQCKCWGTYGAVARTVLFGLAHCCCALGVHHSRGAHAEPQGDAGPRLQRIWHQLCKLP